MPTISTEIRPDIDLADGDFYASDSRTVYRWMRENEPVFRDGRGIAGVASYAAVIEAERNPDLFSNAGGIRPDAGAMAMMIDMDDPQHLKRRKLVSAGFSRKRIRDLDHSIDKLCDTLIDAVCERGECDFVWDLAAPLPMAVIGDMLGVRPADREMFLKWSDALVANLSSNMTDELMAETMQIYGAYTEYTMSAIAERREHPTDDLVSVLTHAQVDGDHLADHEIVTEILLILIGGDETTRHTLSGGYEQLLRRPDQRAALAADPALMPTAIEEMLRWTSPVKNMCRTVTSDVDFHGTALAEGEKVMLLFESANFDEDVFDRPNDFLVDREPNNHIAFGFGTHFCLGNQLARRELTIMMSKLLERLPDMRLTSDEALPLRRANFVSGLEAMPVVFTPSGTVLNAAD